MTEKEPIQSQPRGLFRALGPAIIVASVVIGPGSILTNSRTGAQFGYEMVWVLVTACILMIGMTALSARLGVLMEHTLCEELARRAGRLWAVVAGVSVFLVAACFQFGNNLGVLAAIEPFVETATANQTASDTDAPGDAQSDEEQAANDHVANEHVADAPLWPAATLGVLNLAIIAVLLGLRRLYSPVESLMMILVMIMLAAFAANLFFAQPSLAKTAEGLAPSLPKGDWATSWAPLLGLAATTFSVAGAFYQSYLVREKGWDMESLSQGTLDSILGIVVLAGISLMIMLTSAAVLHPAVLEGALPPEKIEAMSLADVAQQLEPLFGGRVATILFSVGVFAGAFSSFLVNAMIGGSLLSDGLGLGGRMDQIWPKVFTIAALLTGMFVAIGVKMAGMSTLALIVFAQAMTVLAVPVLALAMLFLAFQPDLKQRRGVPMWMKLIAILGCVATAAMAARTVWGIVERFVS